MCSPHRFRDAPPWMPCADGTETGVALVVEVTGTRADIGRGPRTRAYARGGIPLHLLVDHDSSSLALFGDPREDGYGRATNAPSASGSRSPNPSPSTWTRRNSSERPVPWSPRQTSRADGRVGALGRSRGTSGLHRAGWWPTATRGDPRDSATESRPPGPYSYGPGKGETVV
jgi:hypothetical protein